MINQIHLGDCLEVMPGIPDGSVDMILCDLPYGTTQNKWDSIISFTPLWEAYKRVIKENGAIVLTGQSLFSAKLILSNESMYRYSLIWEKSLATGFLNAKKRPLTTHEDILIFSKKQPVYYPQLEKRDNPLKKKREATWESGNYGTFDRVNKIDSYEYSQPKSVLKFGNGNNKTVHPTQKPVALFEYLIKTYTLPGETVLDNCSGSGTTAVACINTGRNFICIEKDLEYWQKSKDRVVQTCINKFL